MAFVRLSPPRELGSEAFSHDYSEMGLAARSNRASSIKSSKVAVACWMRHGGQEQSEETTLGRARHWGEQDMGCLHL